MHVFWQFSLPLIGLAVAFLVVYMVVLLPIVFLNNLFLGGRASSEYSAGSGGSQLFLWFIVYPMVAVLSIVKYYYALGWTAYCSARAREVILMPETADSWAYYITGFVVGALPFVFVSFKERKGAFGSWLSFFIFVVGFVAFSIWGDLIDGIFGWLLRTPFFTHLNSEGPGWL